MVLNHPRNAHLEHLEHRSEAWLLPYALIDTSGSYTNPPASRVPPSTFHTTSKAAATDVRQLSTRRKASTLFVKLCSFSLAVNKIPVPPCKLGTLVSTRLELRSSVFGLDPPETPLNIVEILLHRRFHPHIPAVAHTLIQHPSFRQRELARH